jgi:dipeptidyl aminopeptidase/acylaminoacyl peptidase
MAGSACAQIPGELAALYRYDRAAPLNIEQKELASRKGYRLYSISYALPNGGHMPGLLVTPTAPGRKPAIVWMHSQGAIGFLGNAVLMARAGAVSLLVGEAEGLPGGTAEQARDQLIADVIGLRRAADLLETQTDVDPPRLALVGHSSGAMMGAVAATVDDRFRSAVFEVGLLGMSIHIATSPGPWAKLYERNSAIDCPTFWK